MWTTDSRWFDAAVLTTALVVLTAIFDRFERHKPAWRRVGKIVVLVALVLVAIEGLGRAWGYSVLGLMLVTGLRSTSPCCRSSASTAGLASRVTSSTRCCARSRRREAATLLRIARGSIRRAH
jgi:hypothetical protein